MNKRPLKPCSHPSCNQLSQFNYCDAHKPDKSDTHRYYDRFKRNKKHNSFYHSAAWKKCRDYIKARDTGLCQHCLADKKITVGTIVDHIIPLKVDWSKRFDESNLQLLCLACHNKKTAEDEGKFR